MYRMYHIYIPSSHKRGAPIRSHELPYLKDARGPVLGRFLGAATSIYWNKQLKLIKIEQDINILLSYRWYLNCIILMYISRKEVSALTASMEGHKKVRNTCVYTHLY